MWTLDELVDRVGDALAAEYPGAPNGRVRDVPDRRAIRWYTTIGLVDRPLGMRGRSALYGPRHLLQLVAVKRRQADGHSLAAIQAELAGAGDETLAEVARVPERLLVTDGTTPEDPAPQPRSRFWATSATSVAHVETSVAAPPTFVADPETKDVSPPTEVLKGGPRINTPVGGVRLGGGAILVLPGMPTEDDLTAIAAAAEPLLRTLARRGLLIDPLPNTEDGSPS
jgi:DNA-binding transcriptional MerR regulator